jgi:transposase-like protein
MGERKHTNIPSGKNPNGELTLMEIMKRFATEEAAREYFESCRWPDGPVCAHCGNHDQGRIYKVTPNPTKKIRAGQYKCADCERSFTVTVGTVCEDSHIPLNKWLIAFYMMCASKTQVSALQLQRQLEIGSYRSAWHLCHRIRLALKEIIPAERLGGEGKVVEADTTYIGGKERNKHRSKRNRDHIGGVGKQAVFALVERGGEVRSHHLRRVNAHTLRPILTKHIKDADKTALMTDGEGQYRILLDMFGSHEAVNHSGGEYVRGDAHTNTIEGYFGNAKRSIDGTHHKLSPQHLPLYLAEIDYKYNTRKETDGRRTAIAIPKIVGKRLMLRRPKSSVK